MLSEEAKRYIKNNKNLINDDDWHSFIMGMYNIDFSDEMILSILQFIYFDCEIDILKYITFIPGLLFMSSKIKNLDFLNGYGNLKTIDNLAFMESSLEVANIPDSIERIDSLAFMGCENLKEVYLPKNLYFLSEMAFQDCFNIEKVYIPSVIENKYKNYFNENVKFIYI